MYFRNMAGYRELFTQLSAAPARMLPFRWLQNGWPFPYVAPVYHLAANRPVKHIDALYAVKSARAFERDIDFLCRHFEPVDFATFRAGIHNGFSGSKIPMLLSFDDGLHEIETVVAPILQAKGVPAVLFVNPDFVGNAGLFFRYKASLLIHHFQANPHVLNRAEIQALWPVQRRTPVPADLLKISYAKAAQLDVLAVLSGFDFEEFLKTEQPYLSWAQLQNLQKSGFTIGGHSLSHPMFHELSEQEQIRQAVESVKQVQHHLPGSPSIFAFPFTDYGVKTTFFEQFYGHSMDMSFGCAGLKKEQFSWPHIQRIPLEQGQLTAAEILAGIIPYFYMQRLMGKHIIKR